MSKVKSVINEVFPSKIYQDINVINDTKILGKHGGAYLTRNQSFVLDRFCRINSITIVVGSSTMITLLYRGTKVCSLEFSPTRSSKLYIYFFDYTRARNIREKLYGKNWMVRNGLYVSEYDSLADGIHDIILVIKERYPSFTDKSGNIYSWSR